MGATWPWARRQEVLSFRHMRIFVSSATLAGRSLPSWRCCRYVWTSGIRGSASQKNDEDVPEPTGVAEVMLSPAG